MPHCHEGHDLALPPNSALEAAPVSALTPSSEPITLTEDGRLDTASGAATSTAIEPNTDLVSHEARYSEVPDSLPDSEPPAPPPIESDWAPIMEFTAADIFQHSPFGDILNSLVSLSIRRVLAGLWSKRLGCGQRRNSKPTHHPLCSHCRRSNRPA